MTLLRPEPIVDASPALVDRSVPPGVAASRLARGESLRVGDEYATGVAILAALEAAAPRPASDASYADRQAADASRRAVAARLLAPITGHRVALRGAPTVGFLADLYPESGRFDLPFSAVRDMEGAWNRYRTGIHMAVLGHRVHPYYATYSPTRTTHLELFATWLSGHAGVRSLAIDVGTGCGVLALLLARAGFERVVATDTNPNAVESVVREIARLPEPSPIRAVHADLLGDGREPADLVVFNPPWMPGPVDGPLGLALHYEPGLIERFFGRAVERLAPDGRVVVVFSNVATLLRPDLEHPIQAELGRGRLRLVDKLHRRVPPSRDADGRRRRTRERVEIWEMALAR